MIAKLNGREVEFELSMDKYSDSVIDSAYFLDTGLDLTEEELEDLYLDHKELFKELEEEGLYRN